MIVSGARTSTVLQRLPYLPAADAIVAENGGWVGEWGGRDSRRENVWCAFEGQGGGFGVSNWDKQQLRRHANTAIGLLLCAQVGAFGTQIPRA